MSQSSAPSQTVLQQMLPRSRRTSTASDINQGSSVSQLPTSAGSLGDSTAETIDMVETASSQRSRRQRRNSNRQLHFQSHSRSDRFELVSVQIENRLLHQFPFKVVQSLSISHMIAGLLILFVQFWTSVRIQANLDTIWVRSVNTYGYLCALLSCLAGCSGLALFFQQSKIRCMVFLAVSVSVGLCCGYLLSFYTTYFTEIRMFVSAQGGCKIVKRPHYQEPFACMTFLALAEFFIALVSVLVTSTIINRARACWLRCSFCDICQHQDMEDLEAQPRPVGLSSNPSVSAIVNALGALENDVALSLGLGTSPRRLVSTDSPPSYASQPPPYKP